MSKLKNRLLGDAGEHFVAFQLARRGVSPALLSTNTHGADLIATISGRKSVTIQVKASAGRNNPRTWAVGSHKPDISESFFYLFLNIWDDFERPIACYVVPSSFVAKSVNWEAARPQFVLNKSQEGMYLENWSLLIATLE